MLRLFAGGAAPGIGEEHFAFASERFPRASLDGMFVG